MRDSEVVRKIKWGILKGLPQPIYRKFVDLAEWEARYEKQIQDYVALKKTSK